MRLRIWRALLAVALVLPGVALAARPANPFLDYRSGSWFLPQSPGVMGGAAAGIFNPASFALSDMTGPDFWWNNSDIRKGLDNYGLAMGRNLNFAANTTTFGTPGDNWKIYDYQIGFASGTRGHTFGLGYRWSHGETQRTPREKALVIGSVTRAAKWLSFGSAATVSLESHASEFVFDMGIRPLNSHALTLFADWAVNDDQSFFQGGSWGAGVDLRPYRGVQLGVRARQNQGAGDPDYTGVIGFTWGPTSVLGMPQLGANRDPSQTGYLVRSNPPIRGVGNSAPIFGSHANYYPINLENKVLAYQKYRYFDDSNVAWLDLLALLNAVRDAQDLDLVAINLAGFSGRPSLIWEMREKLLEIRATGKEVVVHTDRTNLMTYYLASAATRISIDPLGEINIPGVTLSRSYLKGTLAKLGIGFQAHRYFKYKSFTETFSRDSMSDADREQRQRIADVIYETLRAGMTSGRDLTSRTMDQLIDDKSTIMADEALAAGLVDATGRWESLLHELNTKFGLSPLDHAPGNYQRRYWDEQWGQPTRIPVVFAVGPCNMDSGIRGRETSAYLRSLIHDPTVKAVVLRADSPGGDVLPSDLIADAVTQLRAAGKPVIVSQGDVAASGGYWISMNGTRILTTPLTVTGSIGVIGAWVWDDGLGTKTGITSDEVHRGRHADLQSTVDIPFLSGIPHRAKTADELARTEHVIRDMYDGFVTSVAKGRGMEHDAVHAVAQGRVWMGGDAIDKGLCDSFGGIEGAINLARQEAGIAAGDEVELVEFPPRQLFAFPSFGPSLPGAAHVLSRLGNLIGWDKWASRAAPLEVAAPGATMVRPAGMSAYELEYLQSLVQARGGVAVLVAPDVLPEAWQNQP